MPVYGIVMDGDRFVSKVGIVGDVHCHTDVLRKTIAALRAHDVDAVLCVGDILDGPGDADATIDELIDGNVICTAGNHERWFLEGHLRDREHATQSLSARSETYLRQLPKTVRFETEHGGALLCHAVGDDDESFLRPSTTGYALQDIVELRTSMHREDVIFMLAGHTHERMVREFPGLTVINAGTIHQDFDASFCVVDFELLSVSFFCALNGAFGELIETVDLPIPPPLPDLAAQ